MQVARPLVALCPSRFGRRPARSEQLAERGAGLAADLRFFATTFTAGFLFVSILIG